MSVLTLRKKPATLTLDERAADASLTGSFARDLFVQAASEMEHAAAELAAVSAEALAEACRLHDLADKSQAEADNNIVSARRIRDLIAF